MSIEIAKSAIDSLISKARVHLYKPIQIAEILYRNRTVKDINTLELETYRNTSKRWRDVICIQFLGRTSTSSAKYQDDLFNETAIPPNILNILAIENDEKNGIVEAYIYRKFLERFSQMHSAISYCNDRNPDNFHLKEFLDLFWNEPGLRRSIDKIYEIIVYSLFSALVEAIDVKIKVFYDESKNEILNDFSDFSDKVLQLSSEISSFVLDAKINRVGVTNAADRGLDMWANFGLAIQIKHLSLTEELAENIVNSVTSDRIIIVCKTTEEKVINSLLTQLGWKSKIQSIITEDELISWYDKALRGRFSNELGQKIIENIKNEIALEFPATNNTEFLDFYKSRGYDILSDENW